MNAATTPALPTWRGVVEHGWVDYNGHMRDAFYALAFSLGIDGLMDHIGLDEAGRARTGHTLYTLEAHLNYLQEVKEGAPIEARVQLLGLDAKRLHVFLWLHRRDDGRLLATGEQMLCNIDTTVSRSAPFADTVRSLLLPLAQAHAHWPRPEQAGRAIALPAAKKP